MLTPNKGLVCWFTGLPCSGKTTLSRILKNELIGMGLPVIHLDGDALRQEISSDLGFSKKDRLIHIRRVSLMARTLAERENIVLVSLVSPYRQARDRARQKIGFFVEIYLRCPVQVCEERDVKGMYQLARQGKIENFTGVSDPYEAPLNAEISIDTSKTNIQDSVDKIIGYLSTHGFSRRASHSTNGVGKF